MADTAASPASDTTPAQRAAASSDLAAQAGAILARARGNQSLRDFANAHGLAFSTIHELEQGLNNPTLARLERVAAMYGVKFAITAERLPT